MALLAKQIPECHRKAVIDVIFIADFLGTARKGPMQLGALTASLCQPGKIAFHICHEDRHARIGKTLSHNLQSDRFPRARRPCDQPMTVGIF